MFEVVVQNVMKEQMDKLLFLGPFKSFLLETCGPFMSWTI